MEIYEFGDAAADSVLIQPVDARELAGMERESADIRRKTGLAFRLAAVPVAVISTRPYWWVVPVCSVPRLVTTASS